MSSPLDILEERVSSAANLIASLRANALRLEQELDSCRSAMAEKAATPPSSPTVDSELAGVIAHLRTEREMVRERIRGLIQEIDRVTR